MSRQFYCMGWKPGEPRKPSSRRYKYLLTAVYAKYFGSVGQVPSATTTTMRENKPDSSGGRTESEDWQSKHSIPTVEEHLQLKTTVRQSTSMSESSIRTSGQFYCMELKRGELQQTLSKMYRYL
ncbi:unnamed protein product [Schistosoma curassoni]|uniref:Uncharacterized protein n=1 Tax=Schistosoma curassoni TaxID=6186 RepID=A0A183K013_9TREM|nr:unnamed protein product [Schistosoma curassoni]